MHLPAPPIAASPFRSLIRPELARHGLLIAMVAIVGAVSLTLSIVVGDRVETERLGSLVTHFLRTVPAMAYFVLLWRFLHMRRTVPADQRAGWLRADLTRSLADPERLVSAAIALVLMVTSLVAFTQLKRLIPLIQPFSWDETFIALDRALHFGVDPWRIAHAVAGHPWVVTAITGAYNFWLFLMYFSLIFACFSMANRAARMQYLVAFVLTWTIGGNLVATVFSSAGPVYVDRLGLGDTFAPLMDLLRAHAVAAPVTVTEIQDLLWDLYVAPEGLNGISAFPSMHVASTVLMMLYARAYHPRFGQVMAVFAGVIMLGSVLLAWHYAVDGYAGALIALGCWWLAGRLVRRAGAAGLAG